MSKFLPILALFLLISILAPSAAEIWTEFFNKFKPEMPEAKHFEKEAEAVFVELDNAQPFIEEMTLDIGAIPQSPVHPNHQKYFLDGALQNSQNSPQNGSSPGTKMLRRMSNSFKRLQNNWAKMRTSADGMVKFFKNLKQPVVKAFLKDIMSKTAMAKQMLMGSTGFNGNFVENFKLHCTKALLALLDKDEIEALEPYKIKTLQDKLTVIGTIGKSVLAIFKSDSQREQCGGDDGHNEQKENIFRLLKTLSRPEMIADPALLKRKGKPDEEHENSPVPAASHGPKRHKRQATIAILFLIILAGVAIFCLFAKYCCSTSGEKAQEIKDLFSGIGEKLEDMQEIFD